MDVICRRTQNLQTAGNLQQTRIGYECGVIETGSRGLPAINIRWSQLEFLLSLGFTPTTMARDNIFGQNVHHNTIQNRMRDWNLRVNSNCEYTLFNAAWTTPHVLCTSCVTRIRMGLYSWLYSIQRHILMIIFGFGPFV